MKPFLLLILFILLIFQLKIQAQTPDIYINEFLASNSTIFADPDFNEFSDWIEIYNNSNEVINLRGYFISDNINNPVGWEINEEILINSKQYLLIWCDNQDTILQSLHTDFRLRREGEMIAIFSDDTNLVDSLTFSSQKTDISSGRNPNEYSLWEFYNPPTPGEANDSSGFIISAEPILSLEEGYYESDQKLYILTKDSLSTIRYTLDGTDPTEISDKFPDTLFLTDRTSEPNVYSEIRTNQDPHEWLPDWIPPAGNVFKATVVKIRSFETGKVAGDVVTKTYFIHEGMKSRYALPVISIVTDPKNLFDETTGIYVPGVNHINGNSNTGNYFQDWEKEVHMSYFEPDGEIGFSQNVGIRIQGGTSPASPQKAFHVIARNIYGNNQIVYPIFKETNGRSKYMPEYKRLIIRAWGSTILSAMFNDALAHRLMEKSDLDLQSYQPVILFINGEYWGLHELREANKSNWYYEAHYGINTDDPGIDLIYHWDNSTQHRPEVNEGDAVHWNNFTNYIHSNDLSKKECYEYVKTQLDIDNFIDYMVHSIYLGKWDWPGNNEATWRPRTNDGIWRYITYDMETGFGVATGLDVSLEFLGPQFNMFNHVMEGTYIPGFSYYGPHLVFKELVKNDEFVNSFITAMEDIINNEYSASTTTAILDEMVDQIEPYLPEHWDRWPFNSDVLSINWYGSINGIRNYMEQRPAHLIDQLEKFKETYANDTEIKKISDFYHYNDFVKFIYSLHDNQNINLQIYTIDGKLYQQKEFTKDSFISFFNNSENNILPKGIYLYSIKVGQEMKTKKVIFIH